MKNLIITAAVQFVPQYVPAHDNFVAQYKVTLAQGFNFHVNADAPGVGKFTKGHILTVSFATQTTYTKPADPAVPGSKAKHYVNIKGDIKILKIELPVKEENNMFSDLPDVHIEKDTVSSPADVHKV